MKAYISEGFGSKRHADEYLFDVVNECRYDLAAISEARAILADVEPFECYSTVGCRPGVAWWDQVLAESLRAFVEETK